MSIEAIGAKLRTVGLGMPRQEELQKPGKDAQQGMPAFMKELMKILDMIIKALDGGGAGGKEGGGGCPPGGMPGGCPPVANKQQPPQPQGPGVIPPVPQPPQPPVAQQPRLPEPPQAPQAPTPPVPPAAPQPPQAPPQPPQAPGGPGTVPGIDTSATGGDLTPRQITQAYGQEIDAAARETGVPKPVLAGMIWQESKGRPNTPGGGLMQIGPNELQAHGGGDINNAGDNIVAGARYMEELIGQFGSIDLALRAYNSGPNGVDPNNPDATPAGTGDPTYIPKVLGAAQQAGG